MAFDIAAIDRASRTFIQMTEHLDKLARKLDQLDRKVAEPKVDVDTKGAEVKLALLAARLKDLGHHAGRANNALGVISKGIAPRSLQAIEFGAKAAAIQLVALGGAGAVTGVAQLGAALVPVAGAAGLLPAAFAAAGVGAATLVAGFWGIGDAIKNAGDPAKFAEALKKLSPEARATVLAFKDLSPSLKDLQLEVQNQLFDGMSARVKDLGGKYIPVLKDGMSGLATEFNFAAQKSANVFADPAAVQATSGALANMRIGFAGVAQAAAPATMALLNLVSVGSNQLPGIGTAIGSIATEFAEWINTAAASGELNTFFGQAVQAVGTLLQLVGNLGSIFLSVFSAASASGGNLLGMLRDGAGALAQFFRSAEGSAVLQNFFSTVRDTMTALLPLLSAIGSTLVSTMLPAIQQVLPVFGAALGSLAPAVEPLGRALASLAPVLNTVATMFVGVLGAAIQTVAPVVIELAPLFEQIAAVVGGVLIQVITDLAPPLMTIARALSNALMPVLPQLGEAFALIVSALVPLIAPLAALAPAFGQIAQAAANVISALAPVITIIGGALAQVVTAIAPMLGEIAVVVGQAIVTAIQVLAPLLPPLIDAFSRILQVVLPIVPVLATMAAQLITALAPILPVIVTGIVALTAAFLPLLPPLARLVQALFPILIGLLNVLVPIITTLARVLITVLVFAITTIVVPALQLIIATVQKVGEFFVWLWNIKVKPAWDLLVAGIRIGGTALGVVFTGIKTGVAAVGTAFEIAVGLIKRVWDGLVNVVKVPVNLVIGIYNNGIVWMWNKVAGLVGARQLDRINYLAGGGVIGGYAPGRDTVPAMLSPGEAVLVPELVRQIGPANIMAANRAASGRPGTRVGFAGGGAVGFAGGGVIGNVLDWIGGAARNVRDMLIDPIGVVKRAIGDSPWIDAAARVPAKAITAAGDFLWDKIQALMISTNAADLVGDVAGWFARLGTGGPLGAMQQFALAQRGKRYQWGAVGPNTYDCSGLVGALWAIAQGKPPHRRYMTTATMGVGRHGMKPGRGAFTVYLGPGHTAANVGGLHAEAYGGNGVPLAIGRVGTPLSFYNRVMHLFAGGGLVGNLAKLKTDPAKQLESFLERGWPEPPVGMKDGGWLEPGRFAYNETSKPEAVFTRDQLRALGSQRVEKHFHLTVNSTKSEMDLRTQFRLLELMSGG